MAMLKRFFVVATLLAAAPGAIAWAAGSSRNAYDGLWSVLIITDQGDCDRGYRYALRIVDGRVTYDNPSFDVSGQVAAGGRVSVTVRYGSQQASGTGRLSGDSGEGVWSGHSTTSRCSGHWEAERRG